MSEGVKSFSQLNPKDEPPYSAWGMYGKDDQLGTLNLLTPQHVLDGVKLVRKGAVFPLNWKLEMAHPFFGRAPMEHKIIQRRETVFDDVYNNFNTQSSSQWDGLTHFGSSFGFYNGVQKDQITHKEGTKLGIENVARRGIAGRAVLIDFERWALQHIEGYNAIDYAITAEEIYRVAAAQGVTFRHGDILLLRTGFISWFLSRSEEEQAEYAAGQPKFSGVKQEEKTLEFLWDNHFAAVAGDSPGFEFWPPTISNLLHPIIISSWGMMIGELFDLDKLAADCASDGCYEMFFTSAPLNKLGGVASPPNAVAIK